jgi:phosphatidylglycerophosphatase A
VSATLPAGGSAARRLLSTAFGLGWLPAAPGTWASAATVLLAALLFGVHGALEPLLPPVLAGPAAPGSAAAWMARGGVLAALAAIGVAGVWLGNRAARDFGVEDPRAFVLDEVAGQGLALLPLLPGPMLWWHALLAFVFFRAFDIAKPPPCARLERLHGGIGIMADDVMAGVYAAALVALLPA